MKYLGIDYGTKRIGIAHSDEAGRFAFPHSVIKNSSDVVQEISEIARKNGAATIIIGESKDYRQKANPVLEPSLRLKAGLEAAGFIVYLEPEFMTSHQAERLRHELKGDVEMRDASAAALILQSFLDKKSS